MSPPPWPNVSHLDTSWLWLSVSLCMTVAFVNLQNHSSNPTRRVWCVWSVRCTCACVEWIGLHGLQTVSSQLWGRPSLCEGQKGCVPPVGNNSDLWGTVLAAAGKHALWASAWDLAAILHPEGEAGGSVRDIHRNTGCAVAPKPQGAAKLWHEDDGIDSRSARHPSRGLQLQVLLGNHLFKDWMHFQQLSW